MYKKTARQAEIQAAFAYEDIQDRSELLPSILTPSLRDRKTAKIRLRSNGLEAIVISDPSITRSGAALAMEVGSFMDPPQHLGMAHLTEHLLSMGSALYPQKNDFEELVARAGGFENAATDSDHTCYFFLTDHPGFLQTLDCFAAFLAGPLFTSEAIDSARSAVNEEYLGKIEDDDRRFARICSETQNPSYPLRFGSGNEKTLESVCHEDVQQWYQKHYSADRAHLAVHSALPLDELIQAVVSCFAGIPRRETPHASDTETITASHQHGTMTYVVPFTDGRDFLVRWETPAGFCTDLADYSVLPFQMLFHAKHKGSVYDQLHRQQNLVHEITVTESPHAYGRGFFQILCVLTKEGVVRYRDVLTLVFQSLNRLIKEIAEKSSYIHELFAERQMMQQLHYQYQDRQVLSLGYMEALANALIVEPLETFSAKRLFLPSYDPKKCSVFKQKLKPKQAMYYLSAPLAELEEVLGKLSVDWKHEKWTNAPYYVQPLSEQYLDHLESVEAKHIAWPSLNPYIPYQLCQTASESAMADVIPSQGTPLPEKIIENQAETVYYWKDDRYFTKDIYLQISFRFPDFSRTARRLHLMNCLIHCLENHVEEKLSLASLASFSVTTSYRHTPEFGPAQLVVEIVGYRDLEILLPLIQEVLQSLKHCHLTEGDLRKNPAYTEKKLESLFYWTERAHEQWRESLVLDYMAQMKQSPAAQAREIVDCMLSKHCYRVNELLTTVDISYDEFQEFVEEYLEGQAAYAEVMIAGDLTREEAACIWKNISSHTPYTTRQEQIQRVLGLQSCSNDAVLLQQSFETVEKSTVSGHALLLRIREAPVSERCRISAAILARGLQQDTFHQLRTQQELAYDVNSGYCLYRGYLYQSFTIQSYKYLPDTLQSRLEEFLTLWCDSLESKMDENAFEAFKTAEIEAIKRPCSTFYGLASTLNSLAFEEEKRDFEIEEKLTKVASTLCYETFKQDCRVFLSTDRIRLIAKVQGKDEKEGPIQTVSVDGQEKAPPSLGMT